MKSIQYYIIAVAQLVCGVMFAQTSYGADAETTAQACWDEALAAYAEKNYDEAIEKLEYVVTLGYGSEDVYYNLANAYFKRGQSLNLATGRSFANGELGRAVLNYRRALKIDPSMEDARYNLDLAVDHTNDTRSLPESLVESLWASMRDMASSNSWAICSIIALVVSLATTLLYLLSQRIVVRKAAFSVAIVMIIAFIATTALAISQRNAQQDDSCAVVVCNDTTPVHASPDSSSKIIRQPSQGVTLNVVRTHGDWSEILFADGEKGWIRSSVIERV